MRPSIVLYPRLSYSKGMTYHAYPIYVSVRANSITTNQTDVIIRSSRKVVD